MLNVPSHRNPHEAGRGPGAPFQLAELLQVFRLRRRLFRIFVGAMVVGCLLRYLLYVPTYTAISTVTVQIPTRNPLSDMGATTDPETAAQELIKKYMRFLKSNGFFLSVAQDLKFKENYNQLVLVRPSELSPAKGTFWSYYFSRGKDSKARVAATRGMNAPEPVLVPLEGLSGLIQDLTQFDTDGTSLITISVNSLDPYTSMAVSNAIAETFVRITADRDRGEVSEVRHFIEKQLKDTTEQLKRSELELVNYKRKNSVLAVDGENKGSAERLGKLDSDIEAARIQYRENEKLLQYYEDSLNGFESGVARKGASAVVHTDAAAISSIRRELDALKRQKDLMSVAGLDESSRQVQEVDSALNAAGTRLEALLNQTHDTLPDTEGPPDPVTARSKISELQKANQRLEAQIRSMQVSREDLIRSFDELPEEEQKLVNLTRNADLQFELYSALNKRLQEVEIQKVSADSKVSIGEMSDMPGPVPRPSLILALLFSAFVGSFFAAVCSFVLEMADSSVKGAGELEEMGVTVLGEVPCLEPEKHHRPGQIRSFRPDLLVCRRMPESPEAMSFRFLRTHLKSCLTPGGDPVRVITLTSPNRGEGKSLVASNLAVSFAQLESSRRTVILDCDLRNPSLSWYLGYQDGEGLASVLTLKSLLEDVTIHDKLPNLDIVPAGWIQESPTELISDEKFALFLEYLKSEYDYVILDSPPVLSAVDASILAPLSDAVVFVVNHRVTPRQSVTDAYQKILQVCQKRVHAVLNNVEKLEPWEWLGWMPGTAELDRFKVTNLRPFQMRRRATDRERIGERVGERAGERVGEKLGEKLAQGKDRRGAA